MLASFAERGMLVAGHNLICSSWQVDKISSHATLNEVDVITRKFKSHSPRILWAMQAHLQFALRRPVGHQN